MIASLVGCGPTGDVLVGASWQYALDGGETASLAPPTIPPGAEAVVVSETTFDLPSTAGVAGLSLHLDAPDWKRMDITLNGHDIRRPVEGVSYRVIPGVDPAFLKAGRNTLRIATHVRNAGDQPMQAEPMRAALVALTAEELVFQTGPILGAFDEDGFTVTCRTNMLADVTLRLRAADGDADDTLVISERGLMHRFDVPRPADAGPMVYRLEASAGNIVRTTAWLPVPNWADVTDGTLRFAVASDVQKVSWTWPTISRAIADQAPSFLVFTGDMVWRGTNNWEWDEQFFGPARELLARTPLYFAIGNHEKESPLIGELLTTPAPNGRDWNWSQQIGDVLLIGIVGHYRFGPETTHYAWLERTLAAADAKFIFLFTHYPAWSSIHFGTLNENGQPIDWVTHQGQAYILPLLAKYNATAYVSGHDHYYERSEPPGGVTTIICGGAGGTLDGRDRGWEHRNPHSTAFASRHHYLLFDVTGETCTMTAIAMNGETIDTRTWQARPRPAATD